jgi:phage/plasmid-associated DNA primase
VLNRNLTFTMSEESRRKIEQLVEESDQFISFVADTVSEDYDWKKFLSGKTTADVYNEFRTWAEDEGYQTPLVRKQFTERCREESGATIRKSHGSLFYDFRGDNGVTTG